MTESAQFHDRPEDFTAQFNSAIRSVNQYNNEYAGNAAIGKSIVGMLRLMLEPEPGDPPQPEITPSEEAEMARSLVKIIQTEELSQMGIKLFDGSNAFDELKADAEKPNSLPSSLELILDDSDAFGEALAKLDPKAEEDVKNTGDSINAVFGTSNKIVFQAYALETEDRDEQERVRLLADRQIDLFADVVPELVKAGFAEVPSVQRMMEYLARKQAGQLTDYVGAVKRNYLDEIPSRWHIDSNGPMLLDKWMTALDYLRDLQQTGSTYFDELFRKLRTDYDTSREQIMHRPADENYMWAKRQSLETIRKRWERQFAIENSFYLADRAEEGFAPTEYDPSIDPKPDLPKPREILPEERWWKQQ